MKNISSAKLNITNKAQCIIALFLAMVIIWSLLSSSVLLVETGDHHCEGHGCSVCAAIFQCLDHIRGFNFLSLLTLCLIIAQILYRLTKPHKISSIAAKLPVTLKVRIND